MAAEEPTNPSPEPTAPPSAASDDLNYPEMIMAAIESSDDKNGSNKSAISRYIEANYGDLPPSHSTLLAHFLNKMKLSGEIVLFKNNYMKPDPNAPPKRGRGRPPKPKDPAALAAAATPATTSPRPRGRPPKAKDPLAPPPQPKKDSAPAPSVSGRKRGRPPKKDKPAVGRPAATPAAAQTDGSVVKRGRGRPPKVKPAVVPVGA